MRGHLLALVCVLAVAGELSASVSSSSSSTLAWRRFKSEHAKVYGPEEEAMRFANFLATKQVVERHNANPNATYKMRVNHMADWTREEWHQLTGFKLNGTPKLEGKDSLSPKLAELIKGPLPKEVDWRKAGNRVTAVKDQGKCGSCWAFAATGLLEGQQAPLGMSSLIPLSEQELLDCSESNNGCAGGNPGWAIDDLAYDLGGIESEADYPYALKNGTCRLDKSKFVMSPTTSDLVQSEKTLLQAVANYGPVAISIFATENFRNYASGVLDDEDCDPSCVQINHAVLVVGYGTDTKGGDYWLIKNSWGAKWGDEGYIKMKRGANMCCIGVEANLAYF